MPQDKNFLPIRVSARFHHGAFRGDRYCDTCIFGISLKNPHFQGESFLALLKAIRAEKKFKKVMIVVTDTLNRFNFERDGEEPGTAFESAKALGKKWRYEDRFTLGEGADYSHQEMIDMVFPKGCGVEVTVETWDEQLSEVTPMTAEHYPEAVLPPDASSSSGQQIQRTAEFDAMHKRVMAFFHAREKKNKFALNVLKAAMKIATDSDDSPVRSPDEQIPYNINYLLEELTVQVCWAINHAHSVAPYPVAKGAGVMTLVKEAFYELTELLGLEKNSLYLEDFMMGSSVKISALHNQHQVSTSRSRARSSLVVSRQEISKSISPPKQKETSILTTQQRHSSQDLSAAISLSALTSLSPSSLVDHALSREHSYNTSSSSSDDDDLSRSASTSPSTSPPPDSTVPVIIPSASSESMTGSPPSISSSPSSPTKIAKHSYSPSTTGMAGFFSPYGSKEESRAAIDSVLSWLLVASQTEDPVVMTKYLLVAVELQKRLAPTAAQYIDNNLPPCELSSSLTSLRQ